MASSEASEQVIHGHEDPENVAHLVARTTDLHHLEQLRLEERELENRLGLAGHKRRHHHHHHSDSSSSDSGPEIKVKNITQLRATSSYRHRDDWLADLHRAFTGAPRRYRTDRRKILLAVENMDSELRAKWSRRVQDTAASPEIEVERDWDRFVKWSLEALGIDQLAHICKELDRAYQREDQTPASFQNYLESLESHLPRDREDIRAYKFYAKLAPTLLQQIDRAAPTIPKTRKELLDLATRFWENRETRETWRRGGRPVIGAGNTGDSGLGGLGGSGDGSGGSKESGGTQRPPVPSTSTQTQASGDHTTTAGGSPENRRLTQEIRNGQRRRGECYRCGIRGHLAKDCTHPAAKVLAYETRDDDDDSIAIRE